MASHPRARIPDAAPTGTSMRLTAAELGTTGGYSVSVPSPCIGFCRLDEVSGICIGCARSKVEIASWKDAPSATLERIWSELPERRARLGIGLHRLSWNWDAIHAFIFDTFRTGAGTWVRGVFGAVAEFCIGPNEECEIITDVSRISAESGRGAIRFDLTDQVRALAMTTTFGTVTKEVVVLAVPRGHVSQPANKGLTALGRDQHAIRSHEREDWLYDFGLGARAAAFCIRTSDPDLTRELDNCIGQEWADLLAKHGGRLVQVSPSRVVLSPIGRIEVLRGLHFGDSASGLAAAVGERLL